MSVSMFQTRWITKGIEGMLGEAVGAAKSVLRCRGKELLRCKTQEIMNSVLQDVAYKVVEQNAGSKVAKTVYYTTMIVWTANDPFNRCCGYVQSLAISHTAYFALNYFGLVKAWPLLAFVL